MDINKLKLTPTDESKELDGQWTSYQGVKILVARTSKPSYMNELVRASKSMKTKLNQIQVPTEEMTEVICKAVSKHLLLDWENFVINGETVEYSKENAYHLLKNDIDFRNYVLEFADEAANYYREEAEQTVGELSTS